MCHSWKQQQSMLAVRVDDHFKEQEAAQEAINAGWRGPSCYWCCRNVPWITSGAQRHSLAAAPCALRGFTDCFPRGRAASDTQTTKEAAFLARSSVRAGPCLPPQRERVRQYGYVYDRVHVSLAWHAVRGTGSLCRPMFLHADVCNTLTLTEQTHSAIANIHIHRTRHHSAHCNHTKRDMAKHTGH